MSDEPYVIKRYSNRKLYDSVRRKFTTLDEVAALLDDGRRVEVRDHDTGIDRTDEVLAQVLRRKAQTTPGSSNFLAELLRAPADVARTVAGSAGLDPTKSEETTMPKNPASAMSAEIAALLKAAREVTSDGKAADTASAVDEANEQIARQESEIQELREQVSQLTQAVTLLLKDKTEAAGE